MTTFLQVIHELTFVFNIIKLKLYRERERVSYFTNHTETNSTHISTTRMTLSAILTAAITVTKLIPIVADWLRAPADVPACPSSGRLIKMRETIMLVLLPCSVKGVGVGPAQRKRGSHTCADNRQ